jgi:HEAT repeat protein
MAVTSVESVLGEVGKAFRVCRFYPSTHPTVQQAMADLSAALRSLAALGTVEFKIQPTGLALGSSGVAARNPQIQELAGLLYAQGYRGMIVEPGVTADEFAALIRSTAGSTVKRTSSPGAETQAPQLPHIRLERVSRKSSTMKPRSSAPGTQVPGEGPALSARSTGVFRPNALPPEIEARRLVALLEMATPEGARGPLGRLGEVAGDLARARDFKTLAEAVAVLARWQRSDDPPASEAAARALAGCVDDGTLSGMVDTITSGGAVEVRRTALEALGALGERAVPALFEAYLAAADEAARDGFAEAIALAGPAAVAYLAARAGSERTDSVRAAATLLGALQCAEAVAPLTLLVRHADAEVRRSAVSALASLGGAEASRLVVAALRDGEAGVRCEAAAGVGRLGDRGLAGVVVARLKDESDDEVGGALIDTLGVLGEARAVPQLVDIARGASGMFQRRAIVMRVAAIRALALIGTPEALAAVAPYKDDRNADVRNAALGGPA